jgi:REP element-mobilizing transposase RayT
MSEKYKVHNPEGVYFITITVVNWIDLLTRKEYKDIVIDSLKYCQQGKGLVLHAFVIMTNHLHLLVSAEDNYVLSDIIRDFKKHTAKKIIEEMKFINESRQEWLLRGFGKAADKIKRNSKYKVWQDGFHPIEVLTGDMLLQKLAYIHDNPVNEGWVYEASDYVYSSASNYECKKGGLEVTYVI